MTEQHLAAPTTQGPADRIGQGSSPGSGPRLTVDTNASATWEVQCFVSSLESIGSECLA